MKGAGIIFALAGAAVGAAASYFVTKKVCDKQKDQELDDIRNMYEDRIKKIVQSKDAMKEMEALKDEMMKEMEKQDKEKKDSEKLASQDANHTDYTQYFDKSKAQVKEAESESIRFITEAEAQKYSKDYELIGLTLYGDDVLIDDETENIIEDFEPWIGKNGIANIRDERGESIYILNPSRKAVYDVTVMEERFGDEDYEPVRID